MSDLTDEEKDQFLQTVPKERRILHIFEFQNSCLLKRTSKSLLELNGNFNHVYFFVAPIRISDIEVNFSGGEAFIEPTKNIERNKIASAIVNLVKEHGKENAKDINIIFIRLIPSKVDSEFTLDSSGKPIKKDSNSSKFETLDISWIEELKEEGSKIHGLMKERIEIKRDVYFGGFFIEEATFYIVLKTNEKYEIDVKNIQIIDIMESGGDKYNYEPMVKDKRNTSLRFLPSIIKDSTEQKRPSEISIKWNISIPKMLRHWIYFGAGIGLGLPIMALLFTLIIPHSIGPIYKELVTSLGAIVALVLGLRLLLFHDVDLLTRWSALYIIIIIIGIIISLSIIFYFTNIDNQNSINDFKNLISNNVTPTLYSSLNKDKME